MPIVYRLFFLSGLISMFVGILQITSLVETTDGLNVWGYFLLLWGIAAFLCALNRFNIGWINKLLAVVGILIHGTVVMYGLLFPVDAETKGVQVIIILSPLFSFISVCCCGLIVGQKSDKTHSNTLSK